MSDNAHTHQFYATPNESSGDPLKLWPHIQIYEQQSEILSHVDYPSLNPRKPETILNQRMPITVNRFVCLKFRRGNCHYGDKCHFSHGIGDLQKLQFHREGLVTHEGNFVGNWDENQSIISKLKLCRRFSNGQECPFGAKCHFLHEDLEKVKEDLGLSKKSFAASISSTTGSGGDCRSGSDQLESKRFVSSSLNANQMSQKPLFYKTRPCYKWEMTGNCPYGKRCYYAHGEAELQKFGTHTVSESEYVCTSKAPVKDASTSKTRIEASYNKHLRVKKCLNKWGVNKISRIYADWIDYVPLVPASLGKVGS